ncbi:hypothetical protein GS4_11_00540 [Gordonia soli NBRC 108243]|uniref:CDP-diacylglycerol diphosphatase n=2 Tax=Gordonia soli TaxID=320799 RepID=M0QHK0_9ACTN|nr:hypothetical protein GS4_11_00540 [Gordonia soli NBRC 108243]
MARTLLALATVGVVALTGGGVVAGVAAAAPGTGSLDLGAPLGTPQVTEPCGLDTDSDGLWLKVKDATVKTPKAGNRVEPVPTQPTRLYAVRNGNDPGGPEDKLLLPVDRVAGIECHLAWSTSFPNLWSVAWTEAKKELPANADVVLGINSQTTRRLHQMHIHMTRVYAPARQAIIAADKAGKVGSGISAWKTHDPIAIPVKKDPTLKERLFRVARVSSLPNLFESLEKTVGAAAMPNQMIAVIGAPGGGYYVLSSDSGIPHGGTSTTDHLFAFAR